MLLEFKLVLKQISSLSKLFWQCHVENVVLAITVGVIP